MDETKTVEVKVGDELAYQHGYRDEWRLVKVVKVTPTGIIKTDGSFTLTPNLRVRGRSGSYYGPYSMTPVTPEIRASIARHQALDQLRHLKWEKLPDETLHKIVELATAVPE